MQKRTLKVAILAVLAIVLVLGMSTVALADQTWPDLPDTVTAKYGITDNQVAGISEGFTDGLWKPYQAVTRAQFTKMAVAAFSIPLADPAVASFVDVPKGSAYYPYIEGAKASGIINGTSATTFGAKDNITRQQAIAIVARFVAQANGYDLATMYSAEEIDALLVHFGDAASISADLRDEVAFAFDMGLTQGDDYGNVKPLANMTRIQGAAFLIRAKALVPPELWTPAKIELISADKTEGLIGQIFSATFEVTDPAGHPAKNVLVDFDSLGGAEFYVGNTTQQATMTNSYGQVTVDLISLEPGTQRVSASVAGVGTIYTTRYWLALDEVYNLKGASAQNNAGVEHEWAARVVVFGPGPRSTSQSDWYNAIDASFDPTDLTVGDGVDATCPGGTDPFAFGDGWTAADETALAALGYKPRTLAGIDVEWAIYDIADNPATTAVETVVSVGNIINVDGVAITPAKTAVGKTDAAGYSSIKVYSEVVGKTLTEAVADYAENPYPEQLFDHLTFQDNQQHYYDWTDQPVNPDALQTKTWIAHTIGGPAGPITAAYDTANIGEEITLTLTLVDTYGNPVAGKSVEWFMQGIGFFQTDDSGDTSDPTFAANNKDFDVTDSAGKATVFVKSYQAGEQIVHAKVRDKGTGGAEGTYMTYSAEVQWFDVNVATFDDITTTGIFTAGTLTDAQNEAVSKNAVNGTHEFCMKVYGLKLEYDPTIDFPNGQTRYIDTDAAGSSYDGIFDAKDAAYLGGILLVNPWDLAEFSAANFTGGHVQAINLTNFGAGYTTPPIVTIDSPASPWGVQAEAHAVVVGGSISQIVIDKAGSGYLAAPNVVITATVAPTTAATAVAVLDAPLAGTGWGYRAGVVVDPITGIVTANATPQTVTVAGRTIKLSLVGGYTKFDWNGDGVKETFEPTSFADLLSPPMTGIYLPLEGKTVTFAAGNTTSVGKIDTAVKVVTDAAGKACATVSSTAKGGQLLKGTVDWAGNPHNGPQLVSAWATKTWQAGTVGAASDVLIEVWIDGVKVATNKDGELAEGSSPMWTVDPATGDFELNDANVVVHVKDAYGNDLPDYEVVYLLENIDGWLFGSQNASDTRIPFAYLVDNDTENEMKDSTGALVQQDLNGDRPDADEPLQASDPYGYIVGNQGTWSFFFNQWLGSDKPVYYGTAGLPTWWTRVAGMGFEGYWAPTEQAWYGYTWPSPWSTPDLMFDGFDGYLDTPPVYDNEGVGLATDGAKAWTLDGWRYAQWNRDPTHLTVPPVGTAVVPNLLSGSNIDIQLAEATYFTALHYKSILRVMVYAPADGVVKEGSYIWSTQVHQEWQVPVPTTVTIAPATDYAVAGLEDQSVVATVKDQYGRPYPGVAVNFSLWLSEGTIDSGTASIPDTSPVVVTDDAGNASFTWTQAAGLWGVENVTATVQAGLWPAQTSSVSVIQWVYDDGTAGTAIDGVTAFPANLLLAVAGEQKITVAPGMTLWDGRTLSIYQNPGALLAGVIGSSPYDDDAVAPGITISTGLKVWYGTEGYFVKASSSDTDNIPNWVYEVVGS